MPVFIAKDQEGRVESAVLARNKELADAYWQGQGIFACSTRELNEDQLDEGTGVIPIVKTKEKVMYTSSSHYRKVRLII